MAASLGVGTIRTAQATASYANKLVVLNIRGGLDGLAAVAPYGDQHLAALRAPLMAPPPGSAGGMFDLGGFYGLHPALRSLYQMYTAGQALVVHAVGNADADRSHFQGQDYLQAGEPMLLGSGWLNRLASFVPSGTGPLQNLVNLGLSTTLLVEGPAPIAGWSPSSFAPLNSSQANEIGALLAPDPLLGPAAAACFADAVTMGEIIGGGPPLPAGLANEVQLAWVAGALLAAPNGPSIAALTFDQVDTHENQVSRLNAELPIVDAIFAALKTSLGSAWNSTVVMTMTEFGRTAAMNGTGGTDHGTGFAMFLAGGAVAGGKIVATWPGLASNQLYQGRDLLPTLDFRQVSASVLSSHLGIGATGLANIFPGGYGSLIPGLIAG